MAKGTHFGQGSKAQRQQNPWKCGPSKIMPGTFHSVHLGNCQGTIWQVSFQQWPAIWPQANYFSSLGFSFSHLQNGVEKSAYLNKTGLNELMFMEYLSVAPGTQWVLQEYLTNQENEHSSVSQFYAWGNRFRETKKYAWLSKKCKSNHNEIPLYTC